MAHPKPEPEPAPRPAALIQSVDRAISVLELLAEHGRAGITEIADELGVHKSTASRLVSVLENRGRGKLPLRFWHRPPARGGDPPADPHKADPAGLRGAGGPARRDGQRRRAA